MRLYQRLLTFVVVSLVSAPFATFFTILVYLLLMLGGPDLKQAILFAARMTTALILRSCAIAIVVGSVVAVTTNEQKGQQIFMIVASAGIGGAMFGLLAAGGSPHISRTLASVAGMIAWNVVAAIVLFAKWMSQRPAA